MSRRLAGLVLAVVTGLGSLVLGYPLLTTHTAHVTLPLLGELHLPSAAIFDLDRHSIPARGSEPQHWHYDVRFVVRARGAEAFVVNEEALALAWKDVSEVAGRPAYDRSLRRLARKWLARGKA